MKRLAWALVCALGLLAAPALADRDGTADQAIRAMHDFAMCTEQNRPHAALRLIATEPGTAAYARLARDISTADCVGNAPWAETTLRFRASLLVGGLYEALYLRQFHGAPLDFSATPPLAYPWPDSQASAEDRAATMALLQVGECVVRAAPEASGALLRTRVTSDEEGAALTRLVPHLPGCISAGAQLTFSRPVLRGLVAQGLYRLSLNSPRRPAPASH